ncbi:ribosomal protein L11 methyltransferase [Clostridia bacterium]|nr:ribosomal protein L11 methyltransferase [Clostridia bacterium]
MNGPKLLIGLSVFYREKFVGMNYFEIKLHTTTQGAEILTPILERNGINGISVDDPKDISDLFENKNDYDWDYWDEGLFEHSKAEGVVVTFYLEENDENVDAISGIRREVSGLAEKASEYGSEVYLGDLRIECQLRSDDEWKDNWKAYFKPFKLTKRLWVKPSWEELHIENDDDIVIELDPGMAFGTGKHETTAICAALLEECLESGMRVLDVGCGSGILSIAAALTGAGHVLGLEIDRDAILVAMENVSKNGCGDKVFVAWADLVDGIEYEADIVVANLMVELVVKLSGMIKKNLKEGGIFIASGILTEKCTVAEGALAENGFTIIKTLAVGEWCALMAKI